PRRRPAGRVGRLPRRADHRGPDDNPGAVVTMWRVTLSSIRFHRRGLTSVFLAILLASTLLTALAVLLDAGRNGGSGPVRYAGADVIVGATQELQAYRSPGSSATKPPVPFSERAGIPD